MKTTTTTTTRPPALRLLAILYIFCLFAPMAAGQGASATDSNWKDKATTVIKNDGDGDGTSWTDAILIASAEELAYFAQQVNAGQPIEYGSDNATIGPGSYFIDYYFALSADINLSGHNWTPIGAGSNSFDGNFDGQGHCVSGLKVAVNGRSDVYAGLFGDAGTIQNLGVCVEGIRGVVEAGNICAGGIAGRAKNVHNCYVVGEGSIEITSGDYEDYGHAGGIVGYLANPSSDESSGSLTNCYATVDIKVATYGERNAGGIVGTCDSNSTISYTYATGDVETGTGHAGGICGYLRSKSTIQNSLALNGRIEGNDSFSNRIVGKQESSTTLNYNYASPVMLVNGKTVSNEAKNDENGNPNVNLDNFSTVFKWDDGWDTSDKTHLPKLKIRMGDDSSYANWPTSGGFTPQSPPDATLYLQAILIANASDGNGSGWDNAIVISNRAELAYFAQQVNADQPIEYGSNGKIEPKDKHNAGGFQGYYFALSADINLSNHNWTPIGTDNNPFKGNFDGDGHCVSGLKVAVNGRSDVYAGLFGDADVGTIQNLGVCVEGIRVAVEEGNISAGGIAGRAKNVHNCYVVGEGSIEITGGNLGHAGGIVGNLTSNGSLTNCYATVKVVTNKEHRAGGIVGTCDSNSTISYTYATGDVEAGTGYAGGNCGYLDSSSTIQNSLALNGRIEGNDSFSNRIVGDKESSATLNDNYASPVMLVNGNTSPDNLVDNKNGANTWLSSFKADLKKEPTGDNNGWVMSWTFPSDYLPQLKKKKKTADGYDVWSSEQLQLNANLYLPSRLYIVSPTGGTLTVTGNSPLTGDSAVMSGTQLNLANSEDTNYRFSEYLSGSSGDNLNSHASNSITMPDADLYLSATFTLNPKLHIVSPTGGTLKVTDKDKELPDGSYIRPGTLLTLAYTEDTNYRFSEYLSGSDGDNLNSHASNSITMPDADLYLSATFTYQEPEPPYVPPVPVYYNVYLPQVEGATTDPGPGEHEVESWETFRFYLTIDSAYSESQPVVTTDRGETLQPRSSDGAYLVKYVRSDVEVFIDGIFKNLPPVANEAISTDALVPQIWTEGSMLCIRMAEALPSTPVSIYTTDGRLHDSFASTPGLNCRQLPTNIYIVRIGDTACKVIIK